jgi:hypothetical protein
MTAAMILLMVCDPPESADPSAAGPHDGRVCLASRALAHPFKMASQDPVGGDWTKNLCPMRKGETAQKTDRDEGRQWVAQKNEFESVTDGK